jgi:hypothetical protein
MLTTVALRKPAENLDRVSPAQKTSCGTGLDQIEAGERDLLYADRSV